MSLSHCVVWCVGPGERSLVAVVGGLAAALLVLLLCYISTVIYCLTVSRRGQYIIVIHEGTSWGGGTSGPACLVCASQYVYVCVCTCKLCIYKWA